MDTYWQKLRFLRSKGFTQGITKAARVAATFGMILSVIGPNPYSPIGQPISTAEAKILEWGDVRPMLTDEADSDETGGFTPLFHYGDVVHPIAVAPNGDIFTAGSVTTAAGVSSNPTIYKSTDGGMKWRQATDPMPGTALVRSIAVSPDYPSDDAIFAVFSDRDGATGAETTDGLLLSIDGGNTFAVAFNGTTAGMDADLMEVEWLAVALSSDFNYDDGSGSIAIGGALVTSDAAGELSTVYRAQTAAFKTDMDAEATWIAMTGGTAEAVPNMTLHLAYAVDDEPIALARLFSTGAMTFAQVATTNVWTATVGGAADEVNTAAGGDMAATHGQVAFDDDYELNGVFYAAVGAGGTVGGVYKFNGSWVSETADEGDCNTAFASLVVSRNGSDARIVASEASGNTVCRSTNGASTFADVEADGGDDVVNEANIDYPGAQTETRLASRRGADQVVYWTSAGDLGGVAKSSNGGSGFSDTGLTNDIYRVSSVSEISATEAFARAVVSDTVSLLEETALFWTNTYGTGAAWVRVDRTPDVSDLLIPGDFATGGTLYLGRAGEGEERLLRCTGGGKNCDATGSDAYDDEEYESVSARSSTTVYIGTNEGHVSMTTDGGGSWTELAMDFGTFIDEFDFTSDPKVFFVTALHSDSTNKVWQTKDSGATFTQVGDAPWGTGDGGMTLTITGYKVADNTGYLLMTCNTADSVNCTTNEAYRLKMGNTAWEDLDLDVTWSSSLATATAGVGDGVMWVLWNSADVAATAGCAAVTGRLFVTFFPFTGDKDDMDPSVCGDDEQANLLLSLPVNPLGAGTVGTGSNPEGYTLQTSSGGRIMEMTLPKAFTSGVTLSSPPTNTSVPSNVGDNGIPVVLRWQDIPGADAYEVLIGLDATLSDGTLITDPDNDAVVELITSNQLTMQDEMFPVIQGNTYYWRVRQSMAEGLAFEGPWSVINSFSVASSGAPTQPEPQLPLDNTTTPNLGPIQFSFNLPAGTVQYQIQITPLNNDGPAINLIIGDPARVASGSFQAEPPVMGQGNYILLPGTTYTWRLRATTKSGAITETDSSWGSWSIIRLFKTPRPSSVTIQPQATGTGNVTTDTTPTFAWKDSNTSNFYYEVQVSGDATFNVDPNTATSFVFWNLIHGGLSTPLNSWTVPDARALAKGVVFWRVRQRVQGTTLGPDEPGVGWGPTQRVTIQ